MVRFLDAQKVFLYLQPATCRLLIEHAVHLSKDGEIDEFLILDAEAEVLLDDALLAGKIRCALTEVMEKSVTYQRRMPPAGSPVGKFVAAIREHEASGVDPEELNKLLQKLGYTNSLNLFDFLIYSKAFSYLQSATCSLLIDYAVHLSKDGRIDETVILNSLERRIAFDRDFELLNPEPPPLTREEQEELLRKAYLGAPPIKLEFDYDGCDKSKVSARTALHWRWQKYQYIDPPVQPSDFAQMLIKHDSEGHVRKPTQDEIVHAFRMHCYVVPHQNSSIS